MMMPATTFDPCALRPLGHTGLNLPQLGFGCSAMGVMRPGVDEAAASAALASAWARGLRYFDTSPWYGRGLSEHRTGTFLRHGTGRPDGATVDAEACLWSAEVVSGRVVRSAPDGREIAAWKLPVSKVTSLAFGGNDLRTLYITSGRYRVSAEELATQPLAGALYALQAPVCGLPATVFRG